MPTYVNISADGNRIKYDPDYDNTGGGTSYPNSGIRSYRVDPTDGTFILVVLDTISGAVEKRILSTRVKVSGVTDSDTADAISKLDALFLTATTTPNVWRNGAGVPSNGLGINADYYLNQTNGDIYKRVAGAYVLQGNIKGDKGDTGEQGEQGEPGETGSAPIPTFLKYTALLNIDEVAYQSDGNLVIGNVYTISNVGENPYVDFSNIAQVIDGTINVVGCIFIATGTTPNSWGAGGQLIVSGCPLFTILNSTDNDYLGEIKWGYQQGGIYVGYKQGAFPSDKTFLGSTPFTPTKDDLPISHLSVTRRSDDLIQLMITRCNIISDGEGGFIFNFSGRDDITFNTPLEFKIKI